MQEYGLNFIRVQHYLEATAIMFVGGFVGIMFVTILRRVMVEDKELPFPESVAASEIHKAGRTGKSGAKFLFWAMGMGATYSDIKTNSVLCCCMGKVYLLCSKEITYR